MFSYFKHFQQFYVIIYLFKQNVEIAWKFECPHSVIQNCIKLESFPKSVFNWAVSWASLKSLHGA